MGIYAYILRAKIHFKFIASKKQIFIVLKCVKFLMFSLLILKNCFLRSFVRIASESVLINNRIFIKTHR